MAEYRLIPALVLEKLRNDTHLEAMTDVKDVIAADPAFAVYFGHAIAAFLAKLAAEKAAMEESAKSQYTEPIAKKDTERDSTLDLVKTLIRNTSLTGTDSQQQAAQFLLSMAKIMKLKTSEQYDKQTGAITLAVDELLGKYLTYTESAGIKTYVETLKRLNDEMCQLLITRDTERGEQGKSRVAESRAETDKAYRELVRQVNALEIAFAIGQLRDAPQTDPFAGFISFMLGLIERYKREILGTSTSTGGTTEEVEVEETETDETETDTDQDTGTDTGGSTGGTGGSTGDNTGGSNTNPNLPPPPTGGGESGFD